MTAAELIARLKDRNPPLVLDVRSHFEFVRGRVPGAIHIPFWTVAARASELSEHRDREIVVYCGHGPRAQMAGAALRARGFSRVIYLEGHMSHWRRNRLPQDKG